MYLPPELIDAVCRHSASDDSHPLYSSHSYADSDSCTSSTTSTTGKEKSGAKRRTRTSPRSTLLSLSLTSSMFLASAQRELFRHLVLTPAPTPTISQNSTTTTTTSASPSSGVLNLLDTLAAHPHLARYVRHFELRASTFSSSSTTTTSSSSPYSNDEEQRTLQALSNALRNMTCLSELVLALPDTPSASPSRVLAHCDPQNLHLLSVSFPLDAHTERFLAKTTCLREVWLAPREGTTERDATRTHCVSETAASIANPVELSQLEVYAGDVDDALRLFGDGPRRNPNLRAMYLRSGTIDASNVHVLQTVSSSLEILELQTQLDPVSILELLSGCETLKGLRWLRIELGRVGRVGMDLYQRVASLLATFPQLEAFNLSGMHWGSTPAPSTVLGSRPDVSSIASSAGLDESSSQPQRQWQTESLLTHTSTEGTTMISASSPSSPALAPAQLAPSIAEEHELALGLDEGFEHGLGPSALNEERDGGEGGDFEGSGDALFFEF